MQTLFEAIPYLSPYKPSFAVIAALCIITLLQNALAAPLAFAKREQQPGMALKYDHRKFSFRVMRTYANSAETLPAFGLAVTVAIVAGASPIWINGLAVVYLVARLAFWFVYYSGVGKVAGGLRSFVFLGGWISNFAVALMAVVAIV